MARHFTSRSEEETEAIGREIAAGLPDDAVIHLIGDLGAGKTTLVRAIATARGADQNEVASPSFAIVHEYPIEGRPPLIHIDGYRLSDNPREWLEIGLDDLLRSEGLKFIEWPKAGFAQLGEKNIEIAITIETDDSRTITVR